MSERSIFAYLLRSPWWVSFVIAVVLGLAARVFLPDDYSQYAFALSIPFVFVGTVALWQQQNVPGRARIDATVEAVSAMSWREFSGLMEKAFLRDGFELKPAQGVADFVLVKAGRTILVSAKRWKAANHGFEPLRELKEACEAMEAQETLYVCVGQLSENAVRYARDNKVGVMQGAQLAKLLCLPKSITSKVKSSAS